MVTMMDREHKVFQSCTIARPGPFTVATGQIYAPAISAFTPSLAFKQWRRPRTKISHLVSLGVSLKEAIKTGVGSKGPYAMSRTPITQMQRVTKWKRRGPLLPVPNRTTSTIMRPHTRVWPKSGPYSWRRVDLRAIAARSGIGPGIGVS
jgi:hypothetical protein